jgi:hypothetical protein
MVSHKYNFVLSKSCTNSYLTLFRTGHPASLPQPINFACFPNPTNSEYCLSHHALCSISHTNLDYLRTRFLIFEQLPYVLFMFTPSPKSVNLMTPVIQNLMPHCSHLRQQESAVTIMRISNLTQTNLDFNIIIS